MPLNHLRRRLVGRLDQADRGDRGWFLITRVHLSTARLKSIAEYIHQLAPGQAVTLQRRHYVELAQAAGVTGEDPGISLRRHHLLAMETPLNLLRRVESQNWQEIALTPLGIALATEDNSNAVLENALAEIVFCREPYYTESRAREYNDFEVRPYIATNHVLQQCEGWIDRDEYDLFVSRTRRRREIGWAVQCIREFRGLQVDEKRALLDEVRRRVPGEKRYQNWRDMSLHTFSLFSLGVSAIRTEQVLRLTQTLVARAAIRPARRAVRIRRAPQELALQIPTPPENDELVAPPIPRTANPGTEGELFVAKLLQSDGWRVVFYTNRRAIGFDLWAQKDNLVMVVEVKSSFDRMGSISLTRLEHEASNHYGDNFYVAVVENLNGTPTTHFIQNPGRLAFEEQLSREYVVRRDVWLAAVTER